MNNTFKIILSAVLLAVVVSLLWFVVSITPIWICSYIFTIITIASLAASFVAYIHRSTGVPQGHSFPITAVTYGVTSTSFSIVAVLADRAGYHFSPILYTIIHVAILVFFIIRVLALLSGAEHIHTLDGQTNEKHDKLNKDKETYWKK